MKIITGDELDNLIATEKVVVMDVYADWCGPCKMMSPILEALEETRDDVTFVKLNADLESERMEELGIKSIPTLIFYSEGKIVSKLFGYQPKQKIIDCLNTIV